MKYIKIFTLLFFLTSFWGLAQCNISNFTVTRTNGTCFSNGSIKVGIPTGQTGCSTRFATLTPVTGPSNTPVTSQTQTLLFPETGGDITFETLPAGKYNIAVSNGITPPTNFASNPVTLTTSYTPMSLTLSSTAPTCSLTSTGYVQNGTFTATVAGGTGPFDYKLTSAFGVQTVTNGTRTQVFNNIKAGENVTIEVTDKVNGNAGCQVSVTQSYSTSTAVPAALAYGFRAYNFVRDCSDPKESKIKFYINLSNLTPARLAILQQPGNAKITIAGVDYPLTYVPARNGFMYDEAAHGIKLVHNMSVTTTFNWECGVLTRTSPVQMPDNWFNLSPKTIVANDCSVKLQFSIFGDQDYVQGPYVDRNIYFCPNNRVKIERRVSTGPDVYEELSGSDISPDPALSTNDLNVTTDPNASIPSASSRYTVNQAGYYRITVSDDYHTHTNFYNLATLTNPLSNVTINPTASVLAGTSGFSFPVYNSGIKYPVSVKIERTDGQTLINHTAAEPLNLAGTYTYNFPMFITWNSDPGILGGIYDLPPGEYRFTLTDGCSNSRVFTSTNTAYANYTPTVNVTQGCNTSNSITFNLNKNGFAFGTNWAPTADVYLYAKNPSGGIGNLIQTVARTGNGTATFVNLPSGSYFVQYNGIGLGYSTGEKRNSPTSYFKEVLIPNYQNFTVSTAAVICDTNTNNTGIISAQITSGTYTYPITFSLFSTSNPSTPIATHIENDTSKTEHSFTTLGTGNYFVRVASSCYSVDQNVAISTNITTPRAIVSDPVICPMSPTTLGAISATNGLYDITWTDDADPSQTVIATGMPVVLSPVATIKYRATFKLKVFLACVNPPIYTSTVDVRVDPNPDVSLAVSDIDLCLAPATKTVTISNSQSGYIYEIVKMNGDSFVPTLSGTGTGGNLTISFPSSFIFAAGTTLKVKTSNGANSKCTDYLTDLITISQSTPIKTLAVEKTDVCQGFTATIKVKASQAQIVYLIKKNGVPVSSIPSQTGNGLDLTFTIPVNQLTVGANNFTVQASNSTCGTVDLDQGVTINSTASPVANAGTAFVKTCLINPNGKQIGMTPVNGINYSWLPTTGLDNPSIANPIANPTETTTYTLTASDGTCTATSTVKVTVITTVPSVSAGADFTKTCASNTTGKQIGSVIQGQSVTYSWTPATGLSSTTIATPIANPSVTTTYRVTATETSSGCTNFDEVTVTVLNTQNPIATSATLANICPTQTVDLTTLQPASVSGFVYEWWTGTTSSRLAQITNTTSYGTSGKVYLWSKSTPEGCYSPLGSEVDITINPLPTANAGNDFTKTCIANTSGKEIGAAPVSGMTYSWLPTTGLDDATKANPIANPTATTTYTLTTTITATGCSAQDTVVVTVNESAPTANAGDDFTKTCVENTSGKEIGAAPVSGMTYSWLPTTGLDGATKANPIANPTVTTTYTLTTTITATGCSAQDTVVVTVNESAPTANAGNDFTKTCVENTSGKEIGAVPVSGMTYSWLPTTGLDDATKANPLANPTVTTTYTLTTTITATGCSAQDTVVVTVDESAPTANAGNDFTKTCVENTSGKEIGAAPVSGMTYSWLPTTGLDDATKANPIANPTATTTYTLTTTITATGCSAQDTVTVTVLNTQKPLALGVTIENNCPAETVDLTTIQPTPVSGIIYEWWTGTASTRLTQINNTSSYETSGKVYLWGKSSTGGCYGLQGSEVEVIITPCCAASVGTLRDISPFSDYYEPADLIKLSHTNYTNTAIVRYVLVNDADGKIKHINNTEPKFFGASAGNYTAHAIVFGPTANPVGIEIGKKLSQIQPFCGATASTRMIVRQNNCSSAETFNTTITNAKAYAFLNLNTNTFDQVNTTGIFINRKDGFHYQIVGFDFTGTATGIQVGGTMTGVSANNLDIILGNVVRGCAPVTTQIDGLIYNDKDKTCKEGNNTQEGLPNTKLYVKLINSKNEVIAVSQVKSPSYLFSFSSDLFDGKYTVIVDDNNDFSDITPTYPANWKGNSQTFTIEFGQIVEFLSNTANFVPLCMQSTTVIATDDTASGIDGFSGVKNVLNILTNDTVDLSTAKINNVNISVITPDATAKLVLNPNGSVDVKAGTPAGIYTFVYEICTINTPKVCAQAKVTITVVAPTIIAVNDDYSTKPINASKGTVLDILANDKIGNGTINATQVSISIIDTNGIEGVTVDAQGRVVIPAGIPIGTYVLTYRICDVINPSNCATASITIVVKDSCDFDDSPSSCDILVHNAFSPNNDGINEVFTIERIEKYPDNSVEIYNRWGVLVFEVSGYDNTSKVFVGLSEGRVTVNKADTLPSGTYYYVVKYKKPISGIVNQKAGFLYISK